MTTFELINTINRAGEIQEVFGTENIVNQYKRALSILHPDVCNTKGATEAFIKLNQLKSAHDKGKIFEDDAGEFEIKNRKSYFNGNLDLLQRSYNNYLLLKNKRDDASLSFQKYLPESMGLSTDLQVSFKHKAVAISRLVLPECHVLWVLSRMLETCAWLSQIGYVHGGIHPESIFIVPKTHGIILPSFYHLKKANTKVSTISGKYKHWYPKEIFNEKRARAKTDLELVKRTAAYLLGDSSGMGVKLRKTHHPALIEFLLKQHTSAFECYDDYRKMLRANFEVKFHELSL
jgi:serine/threonine protein kinase